jgi:hypothetical protein
MTRRTPTLRLLLLLLIVPTLAVGWHVARAGSGPPSSSSSAYAAVSEAMRTMSATRYRHRDREDPTAGTYYFDCVGLVDYFLGRGAPGARAEMRAREGTRRGFVPKPDKMGAFLRSLAARPSRFWRPVGTASSIRPGDVLVMNRLVRADGRTFVGHAMIAAAAPERRGDGGYALRVFDSTGSPHGAGDSRLTDPRAIPSRPGRKAGSGLGTGVVELWADTAGRPVRISWSLGRPPIPTPIEVGRPLA